MVTLLGAPGEGKREAAWCECTAALEMLRVAR